MIEPDANAISSLLEERGIPFSDLSSRGNILVIGIPDAPFLPIETVLYVVALRQALGLRSIYLKHNNRYILID